MENFGAQVMMIYDPQLSSVHFPGTKEIKKWGVIDGSRIHKLCFWGQGCHIHFIITCFKDLLKVLENKEYIGRETMQKAGWILEKKNTSAMWGDSSKQRVSKRGNVIIIKKKILALI